MLQVNKEYTFIAIKKLSKTITCTERLGSQSRRWLLLSLRESLQRMAETAKATVAASGLNVSHQYVIVDDSDQRQQKKG